MIKPKYILFLILPLLGCSSNTPDEPSPVVPEVPVNPVTPEQPPMVFAPSAPELSRGNTPMHESYTLFKVWTYKNTPSTKTETVMPGYQVKYLDASDRWQYDGTKYTTDADIAGQYLKYWDASALSYDFYAYAPVVLPANVTANEDSFSFNLTGHTALSDNSDFLVSHFARHINDLATLQDIDAVTSTAYSPAPDVFSDIVPLTFHHYFSQVEFRIYNSGDVTAYIEQISLNFEDNVLNQSALLNTTGLTYGSDATNAILLKYYGKGSSRLEVEPTNDYVTGSKQLSLTSEIPQSINNKFTATLIVNGSEIFATFNFDDAWEVDKKYIYYLNIKVDGDKSPIFGDIITESFTLGDWDKDDTQTNW